MGNHQIPNLLTKRSFSCSIERMCEIERFSTSRHGRAGGTAGERSDELTPCPATGWMGEASGRGTPLIGCQARMQMRIHAKWWGYRWSQGGTFQPVCSRGHDLERSPARMRKERGQAGLIQGGEHAVVQGCL